MEISLQLAAGLCGLLALFSSALYLWGANKGYDITDEAIFYLQSERPRDVKCYPFFDFLYTSWLYHLTRGSIVIHRTLLFVLHTVATLLFVWGALDLLRSIYPGEFNSFWSQAYVATFLFVASQVRFSCGPRLMYYNHLNGCILLVSTGLLLKALYSENPAVTPYYIATAGALVGLQLFIKVSSYLTNLCVLAAVLLLATAPDIHSGLIPAGYFLAGFVVSTLAHFIFFQSPRQWWSAFSLQLEVARVFSWGTSCVPRHRTELKEYLLTLCRDGSSKYALMGLVIVTAFALPSTANTLAVFGITLAFYELFRSQWIRGAAIFDQPICNFSASVPLGRFFLFAVGAYLLAFLTDPSILIPAEGGMVTFQRHLVVLGYLIALPVIGAIGTSNPINYNFVYQFAAWGTVMVVAFQGIAQRFSAPWLVTGLSVLTATAMTTSTLLLFLLRPYRLRGTLLDHKHPVTICRGEVQVKVDEVTRDFINAIKKTAAENGLKVGDDMIGLFDCPGIVHILGAVSPGHQWYYTMQDMDTMMKVNHYHLTQVPRERRENAFIVEHGETTIFHPYLTDLGIEFPKDYALLGRFFWPVSGKLVSLWKPRRRLAATDAIAPTIYVEDAKAHLAKGDLTAAIASMSDAVAARPEAIDLLLDLANLHLTNQDFSRAGEVYEKVIERDDTNSEALLGIASVRVTQNRLTDARTFVDRVLEREPRHALALKLRGLVAQCAGDWTKARCCYTQVLELNDSDSEALQNLATVEEADGCREQALPLWKRLSEIAPENPLAQQALRGV